MNSELKIKTIKYIDGELEGEALLQFEKLLQTDKALQEEVSFQKEIIQSLKAKSEFEAEREEVVSFLNGLEKKVDLSNLESESDTVLTTDTKTVQEPASENSSQPALVRKLFPLVALAAAAVLLFMFGPWGSSYNSLELADNNHTDFSLESVRSTASELNYADAKEAYEAKNYELAKAGFDSYLKQNPNAPNIWSAKGSTEYQLNQLDEAINSYQQAHKLNTAYHAIAHWYMALAYLKKEDAAKAKTALLQIAEGEEKYAEAQQLLQQIAKIQ